MNEFLPKSIWARLPKINFLSKETNSCLSYNISILALGSVAASPKTMVPVK